MVARPLERRITHNLAWDIAFDQQLGSHRGCTRQCHGVSFAALSRICNSQSPTDASHSQKMLLVVAINCQVRTSFGTDGDRPSHSRYC